MIRLLWVGKERTTESFEQFFALIGSELAKKECSQQTQTK